MPQPVSLSQLTNLTPDQLKANQGVSSIGGTTAAAPMNQPPATAGIVSNPQPINQPTNTNGFAGASATPATSTTPTHSNQQSNIPQPSQPPQTNPPTQQPDQFNAPKPQQPGQLDQNAITKNPEGYKQFQAEAAKSGYNYNDQGQLVSSPSTAPTNQTQIDNAHVSSSGTPVTQTSADDGLINAVNQQTGQNEMVSPNDPRWNNGTLVQNNPSYQTGQSTPTSNTLDALQRLSGQSFDSLMSGAKDLGTDKTGADILKSNLMAQLGAIDDPQMNKYLNNMADKAKASYAIGLNMVQTGKDEITQAINGTLVNPTTMEGLQARIYKDTHDQQLASLDAQKQYQQDQQNIALDDLRSKRSSLEGFLKARMFADGTQDSSAALSVMSLSLHHADMTMAAQNSGYMYAQTQLNIQGMQIMKDYGNNVANLAATEKQNQMKLTSDYYSQLSDIDKQALTNEKDKRQLTASAISDFNKSSLELRNQTLNRQLDQSKFAWQKTNDLATRAIQQSGVTGTVWSQDANGNMIDTGVSTFDSRKNQFTQATDLAGLRLQASAQRTTIGMDAISQAENLGYLPGDKEWQGMLNNISQTLGYPDGALNQFKSYDSLRGFVEESGNTASVIHGMIKDSSSMKGVPQELKDVFGVGKTFTDSNGKPLQCGVGAGSISTAPNVGNTWNQKLATVRKFGTIQEDPQAGYKLLIPLGVNTDGAGGVDKNGNPIQTPGHVETVLSYDPNTRNALIQDFNRTGPGQSGMRIENLDDLKNKYGDNWGFVPGQLKPGVQQQINGIAQKSFQQDTPPAPNWDNINNTLNGPVNSSGAASLYDNIAKKLAGGDIKESDAEFSNLPQGAQTRVRREANQLNPMHSASAADFKTDWLSPAGTNGAAINSFNTAIKHLGVLYDVNAKMKNAGITDVNGAQQWLKAHSSDPTVSEYNSIMPGVADEVAKASTGGAPSVADKAQASAAFDPKLGPKGFLSSIQGQMDLMGGKTNTLINSYNKKMGFYPKNTFDPEAIAAFKKMGMDPGKFDPSLATNTTTPQSGNESNAYFFHQNTGNDMNNFNVGSTPKASDSLGLGIGGDSLGLFK